MYDLWVIKIMTYLPEFYLLCTFTDYIYYFNNKLMLRYFKTLPDLQNGKKLYKYKH